MHKMWCSNNLDTIGKWAGKMSSLFGVLIAVFVLKESFSLNAYAFDTFSTGSYKPMEFKLDLNSINKINVQKIFKFGQSINGMPLSTIKSPSPDTNFSKFFSSSRITSNDVSSFLKEAAITSAKLTMLVVSITVQVLKGLVSVFK